MMEDKRIIEFEKALWIGGGDVYRRCVADDCLMVVPETPFILGGKEAIDAVERTPRWSGVELSDLKVSRVQDGIIVIAYRVNAQRDDQRFTAFCTSTYRKNSNEDWQVIQHQQTLVPTA